MRPLKFRAWDGRHLYEVKHIDLLADGDAYASAGGMTDSTLVEQFTGLHDKNGMEIYEGDIVRRAQPLPQQTGLKHVDYIPQGPVVYDAPNYYFDDTEMGYQQLALGVTESSPSFEVIGNIHENPELVK